jgi:tripeptidyl-peptidase I
LVLSCLIHVQEYHVWEHASGDTLIRTTSYSLPEHLDDHVELIQPTTLFSRFRGMKTSFHFDQASSSSSDAADAPAINVPSASGGHVDASCNTTVTVSCLKQLYNAVGFTPSAKGNQVAATGYLDQFANFADLQAFYKDQVPAAVNSSFKVVSINGKYIVILHCRLRFSFIFERWSKQPKRARSRGKSR